MKSPLITPPCLLVFNHKVALIKWELDMHLVLEFTVSVINYNYLQTWSDIIYWHIIINISALYVRE